MTAPNNTPPRSVSELFPSPWLHADDLNGRTVTVTIRQVTVESIRNPQTRKSEWKAVLDFGRSKRLIVNKTQSLALADIANNEEFAAWSGLTISLSPAVAHNGKPTIAIQRPARPALGEEIDHD